MNNKDFRSIPEYTNNHPLVNILVNTNGDFVYLDAFTSSTFLYCVGLITMEYKSKYQYYIQYGSWYTKYGELQSGELSPNDVVQIGSQV